jgi:hypothetical protein
LAQEGAYANIDGTDLDAIGKAEIKQAVDRGYLFLSSDVYYEWEEKELCEESLHQRCVLVAIFEQRDRLAWSVTAENPRYESDATDPLNVTNDQLIAVRVRFIQIRSRTRLPRRVTARLTHASAQEVRCMSSTRDAEEEMTTFLTQLGRQTEPDHPHPADLKPDMTAQFRLVWSHIRPSNN